MIPGLDEDVAAGDRDQRRDVADAVLLVGLCHRQLVVAAEHQLAIDDLVDRVGAPAQLIGGPAARSGAAAPLVGEEDLLAVIVEGRAVPVREDRIGDGVDAAPGWPGSRCRSAGRCPRRSRRPDRAPRYTVMSWHEFVSGTAPGDPRRVMRGLRRVLQAVDRAGRLVAEQPRLGDDRRVLRLRERDPDDLDPPLRRVRVGRRAGVAAASGRRPGRSCPRCRRRRCRRVRAVLALDEGVRVDAAAGLDAADLDRVR